MLLAEKSIAVVPKATYVLQLAPLAFSFLRRDDGGCALLILGHNISRRLASAGNTITGNLGVTLNTTRESERKCFAPHIACIHTCMWDFYNIAIL